MSICTNLTSPETTVPAEDLCLQQYVSLLISFHAIIFRKSCCWSQTGAKAI